MGYDYEKNINYINTTERKIVRCGVRNAAQHEFDGMDT